MTPTGAERALKIILRVEGAVLALATVAVFLPFETMQRIHGLMTDVELPELPVVEYLARSLSFFYAAQSPLYFLAAADLRRQRVLALYLCWFHVALGIAMTCVDLEAGLPASWTWGEGPPAFAVGVVSLWLLARVPRASAD